MKRPLLFFVSALICFNISAQQINGVFTNFAINNQWANTAINTATQETSGFITLGGYYDGRAPERKYPMMLQISTGGFIRTDFGGGGVHLISSINSSNGSTQVDKTFLANTSSTANSQQFMVAGQENGGDGFLFKTFASGVRPTAFNGGNTFNFSGGAASDHGYIEDWVTGSVVYSIRLNGATFTQTKVVLATHSKETGAPLTSFGTAGTLRIDPPADYVIDQARPTRMALSGNGNHFYVAFSVVPSMGTAIGVAVCRINSSGGNIDSSFGTNGYKVFPTASRYYVTSLLVNNDESVTVGGYGGDGLESPPSFFTFKIDGSIVITSFNYLLGQPNPGNGSKNIGAKKAVLNGQDRIVFAYAHPINTSGQYRIAIASLTPSGGAGGDPLAHTPWLGSDYVSAEPTSIITLSGNAGFIVTGVATRHNGSTAGVVLKYTNDGTLNPGFGTAGVLILNGRGGGPQWSYATQLSTNKYLAVGAAEFVSGDPGKKALLLNRFNSDGSVDSSFGINGTINRFQSDYARAGQQIVALPNGEFLVEGSYFSTINEPGTAGGAADNEAIVAKFNEDGTPYLSFGPFNNGRYHYPGSTLGNMKVIGENIYVSANTVGHVLKLSAGGNLVNSFATGLSLVQEYTLNETTGYLYAGGIRNNITAKQVVKLTPAGNIDASYGTGGYVALPIPAAGDNVNVNELKVRPGGGLLAVMQWNTNGFASYGVFFSSISETGVLDLSFGTNGAKFLQLPGASNILVNRYKCSGQNNDKLLAFGQATVNSVTQGFVCQVDINGDLDPLFGNNGVIWTTERFVGTIGFDNQGNALAIKDYGFYNGSALMKVNIPANVYNHIKPGSWTGVIDNDWFKPGNWAEGLVPDAFTAVTIGNGNVLIGPGMNAFAWSVSVATGANLTIGANGTLEVTQEEE
ncbi:MAG: hypothetical protein H7Y86_10920 [Rhizobacter sp.]|nr:hypothetical protein [Ferruginibacter sp.]